ncbi:MAG: outer membrane protein assembly factor BamA [Nitrospirae bacterium]|nr:outer membrane protein assembly factor BamA [Nitrospirota bacterium]
MKNRKFKIRRCNRRHKAINRYAVLFVVFCLAHATSFLSPVFSFASDTKAVVKDIGVHGLTRITDRELVDLISINIGDILDGEKLSQGIRRAFKKGIFLDLKAESEPYKDGIKLIYIAEEMPLVRSVIIEGSSNLSEGEIKKAFAYKEGMEFRIEFLNSAVSRLFRYYRNKGFPDARVDAFVEDQKMNGTVSVRIRIDEGAPQIIKTLNMPDEFKDYIHIKAGDVFDREKIDRDIKKLKEYFRKLDYINPHVGPYKFSDGALTIPVSPGQKLKIAFEKNQAINRKRLLKELPFMEDGDVTDESVEEATDNIRNLYLVEGYYNAKVASAYKTNKGYINVTFFIFEGERVFLREVSFSGNTISNDVLKSIIPFEENKPFNAILLNESKDALIIFYNALGYLQAGVAEIKTDLHNDNKGLSLEFVINEGRQTMIKSVRISGNRDISASDIQSVLNLKVDAPYNIIDIRDARYRILSLYGKRGYMDVRIEVKSTIDEDKAFLDYEITENRPSVAGKIIIRGNVKTKEKIIRRELAVAEGETYNYEEVLNTKERLYRLGLFSEVKIDILEPYNEEDGYEKDMLITLKESNPGSVEMSLGYGDYEKFRGSIDVRYTNIGGYNRQIGFRTEISAVEKKYIFDFREPRFFDNYALPFSASLTKESRSAVNIETKDVLYKIDKISFIAGTEKELRKGLKAGLNYEYSINDTTDVTPGVILSREDTGTLAISSISPSLFYDLRDNPFDPTSGSLHGVTLKFASKAYLSETEFIKGTFQSSWFFLLKKGIVFAVSLKGGAAHSFGETDLPLIERFFLGGRTTVRGYGHDMLGPKGAENAPTGGNAFALVNGEFRIPIRRGFGIVTFVDAGNVWRTVKDVSGELKYTAGIGLRYRTPVGPVRIDYGHKLNREQDESTGEFHFSFGHAF